MTNYYFTQYWFQNSEFKQEIFKYINIVNDINILEIGCYEGMSTTFLSDNLLYGNQSHLVCVDPFLSYKNNDHLHLLQNNQENIFYNNIQQSNNYKKTTFFKKTSCDFFKTNLEYFDLIYIDGCHNIDILEKDLINSFKVLNDNGIMWMDDYLGGIEGDNRIKECIDNFIQSNLNKCKIIHIGYQIAIKKI